MAASPPRPITAADDRVAFDCGRESFNEWFRRHALKNHLGGASRVNVIEDADRKRIIGYVSLSSSQIERAFLPKAMQRNSPDPIPVTLLGQLAVDKHYGGRRHAASLLRFALFTAVRASQQVGSFGLITHPLDDAVRGFHLRWGFEDLALYPGRVMILRMTDIRSALGIDDP
jgi:predicted N-acetyltransferase YhbS